MAFASAQSRLHTLVSAVVVLGFIFQLGACPCGCLEHNYWAQALGLSPHESHIVDNHGTELAIHGDHDHDCTGVAATVFVNNARTIESPDLGPSVWVCCAAGTAELQLACHRGEVSRRSPHDLWGHGRTPSELQVFLL